MATTNKTEKPLKTATAPVTAVEPTRANLSSIKDLLSESWELLKTNWGSFTALFFIQGFTFVVLFGIAAVIGIAGGVGAGLQGQNLETLFEGNNFMPVLATAGLFVFALIMLAAILAMVIGTIFQGAFIALANAGEEKMGVGEALRLGRAKWKPLLAAAFVGAALIFPSFFVFFIPGIVFSMLFGLAAYAVVIENMGGVEALRRVGGLVKHNFWEVFGRFAVLFLINIGINIVLGIIVGVIQTAVGEDVASLVDGIGGLITSIGMMAFSVIYATVLYRQLMTAKNVPPFSLKLPAIVALIGLLIMISLGVAFSNFLRLYGPAMSDSIRRSMEEGNSMESGNQDMMYFDDPNMDDSGAETMDYENMTEEDWERLMDQAMREATASGNMR